MNLLSPTYVVVEFSHAILNNVCKMSWSTIIHKPHAYPFSLRARSFAGIEESSDNVPIVWRPTGKQQFYVHNSNVGDNIGDNIVRCKQV